MERKESGIWNLAGDEDNRSRAEWYGNLRSQWESCMPSSTKANVKVEFLKTAELAQPAKRPLHAGAKTTKRESADLFTRDSGAILQEIIKERT